MIEIQKLFLRIPAPDAEAGRRIGEAVAAGLSGLDYPIEMNSNRIDQLRIRINVAEGAGATEIAHVISYQVTQQLNEIYQRK